MTTLPSPTARIPADDQSPRREPDEQDPSHGTGCGECDHERDRRDHGQDGSVAEDDLEVDRDLEERRGLGVGDDEPDEQRDRHGPTLDPRGGLARATSPAFDGQAGADQEQPDDDERDAGAIRSLDLEPDQAGRDDDDAERPDGGDDDGVPLRRSGRWQVAPVPPGVDERDDGRGGRSGERRGARPGRPEQGQQDRAGGAGGAIRAIREPDGGGAVHALERRRDPRQGDRQDDARGTDVEEPSSHEQGAIGEEETADAGHDQRPERDEHDPSPSVGVAEHAADKKHPRGHDRCGQQQRLDLGPLPNRRLHRGEARREDPRRQTGRQESQRRSDQRLHRAWFAIEVGQERRER